MMSILAIRNPFCRGAQRAPYLGDKSSAVETCFCDNRDGLSCIAIQPGSLQRLDTLSAWRESPFFTARERAALALAEAITHIHQGPVPDAVYEEAAQRFGQPELAQVIFAAISMNALNRIAVTSQMPTPAR